jgi:hypothetical protein
VCGRARDPHHHQRDLSRIDLSIRRDGSKQFFLGIIALERSVFFLVAKVFLEELVVFEQLDHERELVGAWVGRFLACLLVCLHCFSGAWSGEGEGEQLWKPAEESPGEGSK